MGVLDWLVGATPAGAGKAVAEGVLGGLTDLIRTFKLPPEQQLQFEQRLAELAHQARQLDAQDRDSARKREMGVKDGTPAKLAFLIVGAFIAVALFVVIHPYAFPGTKLEPEMLGMVGAVIGYLSAKAEQVASYYFGSSAGSQAKDTTIVNMSNK